MAQPEHSWTVTSRQRQPGRRAEDSITTRSLVTDGGQVLAMARQSRGGDPIRRHPNARYPRQELVKRTLTYPERSLVKRTTTQPERLLVKRTLTYWER